MINRIEFYNQYRKRFTNPIPQAVVTGIEAMLTFWESEGTDIDEQLAYCLATAYHETGGRFEAVREGFKDTDEEARQHVKWMSESDRIPWVTKDYAKRQDNGHSYYGRGLVQITHPENYLLVGECIGLGTQLYDNPDKALELNTAVRILFSGMMLGLFTSKRLDKYINSGGCDFINARRVVNGTDRAKQIAGYARGFLKCLRG